MGTQERKQREYAAREKQFIAAAQAIIREDGLLNLQMSRVAVSCDYATGTLYQHFASKEDLLLAVATDAMQRRAAAFAPLPSLPLPSRERMLAVILTDIEHGRREPDHFRLVQYVTTEVIWDSASPERRRLLLAEGAPIGEAVSRIVADALASGDLEASPLRPIEIAAGPWCLNTGMHTLVHAHGLLEAYAVRDAYGLLLRHSHALLNGLGWKPLLDPRDTDAIAGQKKRILRALADHSLPSAAAAT